MLLSIYTDNRCNIMQYDRVWKYNTKVSYRKCYAYYQSYTIITEQRLFTAYHSQIDREIKRINRKIEIANPLSFSLNLNFNFNYGLDPNPISSW